MAAGWLAGCRSSRFNREDNDDRDSIGGFCSIVTSVRESLHIRLLYDVYYLSECSMSLDGIIAPRDLASYLMFRISANGSHSGHLRLPIT